MRFDVHFRQVFPLDLYKRNIRAGFVDLIGHLYTFYV